MYSFDVLKGNLKPYLKDYLILSNINPNKPFRCLNPKHSDENPSMAYNKKNNTCKCFGCGISYDLFNLINIDLGITSFKEQIEKATELFIDEKLDSRIFEMPTPKESEEKIIVIDYTNYFDKCNKNMNKTKYLLDRNIDEDLIQKYNIGYDESKQVIVIPLNKNSYYARSVINNSKYKSKGVSYLFNEDLLINSNKNTLIYITESVFDSLSLETLNPNIKTIALNGNTNYIRLLEKCQEYKFPGTFILALDKDSSGRQYQEIISNELQKLNIRSFSNSLIPPFEDCKDINEALIVDKEKLKNTFDYFHKSYTTIIENLVDISKNKEVDNNYGI